ncbi:hypothetical protein ACH4ND_01330 [Streptomyces sp. NPDC017179]|uniref:hypothetical protein n=1 Tax=Streptomyces sp. NPDC017179 TaxID=3364979 RepID=UPI0037A19D53
MNTRAVNAAAGVIAAAMQQGKTIPASLAIALDSARLLNSPETAAEFERLRGRVAKLEELLVAKDRPVDEDPIAYALTPAAENLRAKDDVMPQVRTLRWLLAEQRQDADAEADGITRQIAPTQALRQEMGADK